MNNNSHWLLHSWEHTICEKFPTDRTYPQNDQNKWQNETNVQQNLHEAIVFAILQWIPMHASHTKSWEGEYGTKYTARNRNCEFHYDFRCWSSEKWINSSNYLIKYKTIKIFHSNYSANLRRANTAILQVDRCTLIEALIRLFQPNFECVLVYDQHHHGNE